MTCPEDIARIRVEKRNLDLAGSFFIEPNTYEVLRARFEPLGSDEPHQIVDTTNRDPTWTAAPDFAIENGRNTGG